MCESEREREGGGERKLSEIFVAVVVFVVRDGFVCMEVAKIGPITISRANSSTCQKSSKLLQVIETWSHGQTVACRARGPRSNPSSSQSFDLSSVIRW